MLTIFTEARFDTLGYFSQHMIVILDTKNLAG